LGAYHDSHDDATGVSPVTARDVFLSVGAQPSLSALVGQATLAENLGYDRVWMPESWGRDAVTVLSTIAGETDDVGIGSCILPVYSRSPALLGQTAATLQEASAGRFRMGVGPSGPIVIENWHGMEYGNPLRRTRETIEVTRQVLSGEEVEYDGEYVDVGGFRLRCDPPDPAPPIDAAALGPKATELAGRFADGWLPGAYTGDGFRQRVADYERGLDLGDRDREDTRVTLSLTCAVNDDDPERAREIVVQHTAFYIGGMGTFYRDALARRGRKDLANDIYDAWQDGDREHAMDRVREELYGELCFGGTASEVREAVDRCADDLENADAVSISFPRGADVGEIEATMDALAPE
jgi:coenzyme F420-dependent oxidoreductase